MCDGGRQAVSLSSKMTLQELGEKARRSLLINKKCRTGSVIELSIGFPPQRLDLNHRIARSVIPTMTCIHVAIRDSMKRVREEEPEVKTTDSLERKKTALIGTANANAIDLAKDDDRDPTLDDDEALARRLHQEEVSAVAREQLKYTTTTTAAQDRRQGGSTDPRDPTVVTASEYWIWKKGPELYRNDSVSGLSSIRPPGFLKGGRPSRAP